MAEVYTFSSLPVELLLHLLSYLELPSLIAIPRLSRAFYRFFNDEQNKSVIWKNACVLHGLIGFSNINNSGSEPPRREWGRWHEWALEQRAAARDVKWEDVRDLYSDQSIGDIMQTDWKMFLKRRLDIHHSWSGQLPSTIVRYAGTEAVFSKTSRSHMARLQRAYNMFKNVSPESPKPPVIDQATVGYYGERIFRGGPGLARQIERAKKDLRINPAYPFERDIELVMVLLGPEIAFKMRGPFLELAETFLPSSGDVHRIKVDERNGFYITTSQEGGLVVREIGSGEIAWCLPKSYVRSHAHLEYEQGYLIFDRVDGSKEVWKSTSIAPRTTSMPPDRSQRLASALANGDNDRFLQQDIQARHERSGMPSPFLGGQEREIGVCQTLDICSELFTGHEFLAYGRFEGFLALASQMLDEWGRAEEDVASAPDIGPTRLAPQFVPHMLISVPVMPFHAVPTPDPTRAYRFVYPHLLAASASRAYVWDVRTGEQVQIVDPIHKLQVPTTYLPAGKAEVRTPAGVVRVLGVSTNMDVDEGEQAGSASSTRHDELKGEEQDVTHDKGKARAVVEEEDEAEGEENDDPAFPTYRPFQSGFFDENALFSGNFQAPPLKSSATISVAPVADSLALHTNMPAPLGNVHYVELGERWIFVCGEEGLRVFARNDYTHLDTNSNEKDAPISKPPFKPGALMLRIPSDKIQYARWSARLGPESVRPHRGSELVRQEVVWDEEMGGREEEEANVLDVPTLSQIPDYVWGQRWDRHHRVQDRAGGAGEEVVVKRRRRLFDEFIAVHVSPDQKHVAALLGSSRLLFLPHFERLVMREKPLWDVGVDVQLGSVKAQSVYLSYGVGESGSGGCAGRVGVVTLRGIFVVTPYFRNASASTQTGLGREVDLVVLRLAPSFMDPGRLAHISCLQMSDTGIWVNWTVIERKEGVEGDLMLQTGVEDRSIRVIFDDEDGEEGDEDEQDMDEEYWDNWEEEEQEDDDDSFDFDINEDRGAVTVTINGGGSSGNRNDEYNLRWTSSRDFPLLAMGATPRDDSSSTEQASASLKAKGKQPERSGADSNSNSDSAEPRILPEPRSWLTQQWPLDSGKWNAAEKPTRKLLDDVKENSSLHEADFVGGLKQRRIKEKGVRGDGVELRVNGDMEVDTFSAELDHPWSRPANSPCEVHQIRFVP